jgi:hypothetical protein
MSCYCSQIAARICSLTSIRHGYTPVRASGVPCVATVFGNDLVLAASLVCQAPRHMVLAVATILNDLCLVGGRRTLDIQIFPTVFRDEVAVRPRRHGHARCPSPLRADCRRGIIAMPRAGCHYPIESVCNTGTTKPMRHRQCYASPHPSTSYCQSQFGNIRLRTHRFPTSGCRRNC